MKYSLLLFILFLTPLFAGERIDSTLDQVDLIIADIYNDDGHNYGEEYFVHNRNPFPMRISIRLTDTENAINQLAPYTVIVDGQTRVSLGRVTQDLLTTPSKWDYEWKVQKDRTMTSIGLIK